MDVQNFDAVGPVPSGKSKAEIETQKLPGGHYTNAQPITIHHLWNLANLRFSRHPRRWTPFEFSRFRATRVSAVEESDNLTRGEPPSDCYLSTCSAVSILYRFTDP
jgi:hypothetical protein